jgi:hypothetical protein
MFLLIFLIRSMLPEVEKTYSQSNVSGFFGRTCNIRIVRITFIRVRTGRAKLKHWELNSEILH